MIYTDLAGQYFDWLYERVCGDWEPKGLSFHRLLAFLYNQNFTPSCELDGARAEDGLDLRYRFAQTQNIVYQDVQDAFTGIPCSMLEMMVALSIRIEEHILEDAASGNRVGQWFWNMVVSLGLVAMDDTRFDKERAQSVMDRFNAREYQPNGAGGLFTLMHPTEDIDFCMKFAEKYGYQFEHEATYEKMCLVNNAVYIARYMDAADCKARYGYVPGDNEKEGGEWTATGTQFQVPYVFKTLFSHEDIVFNDLCETKSVSKGAIYLDKNEDLAEGEHNYIFVGRVGQFCPIKPGCGGALLVREAGAKDNGETKYDSVTGAKDYRWLESEMVYNLHLEDTIDRSYFDKMATKAVEAISEYGDFEQFASNDLGEPPWQKPDIPWDDVQDEAAQNFDVR